MCIIQLVISAQFKNLTLWSIRAYQMDCLNIWKGNLSAEECI